MRRRLTVLLAPCLVVLLSGPVEASQTGIGWVHEGTPVAGVSSGDQSGGSAGSSGGSSETCTYEPLPAGAHVYNPDGSEDIRSEPGAWWVRTCSGPSGATGLLVFIADQPVDPAQLAQDALRALPLELPSVGTNPAPGEEQLVRVPTWLWIDDWGPRSATASVPGVSVTVTAVPQSVTWDMGNGDAVTCAGPGVAYDRSRPSREQSTDCSYTYQHSSVSQPGERYRTAATVTWGVSWSASGVNGGGDLGVLERTSQFSLRVAEAQSLQTS